MFYLYFIYLFIYLFIIDIMIIIIFTFLIMISPLLAGDVRVGRLCWVVQVPVVLAAGGRPTKLDNGRAKAYCV